MSILVTSGTSGKAPRQEDSKRRKASGFPFITTTGESSLQGTAVLTFKMRRKQRLASLIEKDGMDDKQLLCNYII